MTHMMQSTYTLRPPIPPTSFHQSWTSLVLSAPPLQAALTLNTQRQMPPKKMDSSRGEKTRYLKLSESENVKTVMMSSDMSRSIQVASCWCRAGASLGLASRKLTRPFVTKLTKLRVSPDQRGGCSGSKKL